MAPWEWGLGLPVVRLLPSPTPRHLQHVWVVALVEVLERKGVLTRQEIYDAITELRQRHPEATTLERPARGTIRRPT